MYFLKTVNDSHLKLQAVQTVTTAQPSRGQSASFDLIKPVSSVKRSKPAPSKTASTSSTKATTTTTSKPAPSKTASTSSTKATTTTTSKIKARKPTTTTTTSKIKARTFTTSTTTATNRKVKATVSSKRTTPKVIQTRPRKTIPTRRRSTLTTKPMTPEPTLKPTTSISSILTSMKPFRTTTMAQTRVSTSTTLISTSVEAPPVKEVKILMFPI
jgi:hypothetical protein